MSTEGPYCRQCGRELMESIIASEQRACCLNAKTIAGVCSTHGPLGPHHVVESVGEADDRVDESANE